MNEENSFSLSEEPHHAHHNRSGPRRNHHDVDRGALGWRKDDFHIQEGRKKRIHHGPSNRHDELSSSSEADRQHFLETCETEARVRGNVDGSKFDSALGALTALPKRPTGIAMEADDAEADLPLFEELLTDVHSTLSGLVEEVPGYESHCFKQLMRTAGTLILCSTFALAHRGTGGSKDHPVFDQIERLMQDFQNHKQAFIDELEADENTGNEEGEEDEKLESEKSVKNDLSGSYDTKEGEEKEEVGDDEDEFFFSDDSACDLDEIGGDKAFSEPLRKTVLQRIEETLPARMAPTSGDADLTAYEKRVERMAAQHKARLMEREEKASLPRSNRKEELTSTLAADLVRQIQDYKDSTKEFRRAKAKGKREYEALYYDPSVDRLQSPDEKRPITRAMEKGDAGLRRSKPKHRSMGRTSLRQRYTRAKVLNEKSAVQTQEYSGTYTGEAKGIRTNVIHSRKLS
ncbi:Sas10 domain-containing protein [Giardia muris]|uniref:Sas10 domain-containing protein n=1 Tax=Giardia muris TaxID=5742 RepID=A0A4Z1T038_GIAMU|nr:Sas10 domain-containing protein [Giardia muris]|eukprot:TNJ29068.1 Sas10 domain-containing protein [Giardia muris]